MPGPLLTIDLTVDYPNRPAVLQDLRLTMEPGEILGLAGESGSGKSTLALALLQLLRHKGARARGSVQFQGQNLLELPPRAMRSLRGNRLALVLQSPLAALNPMLRIGTHFRESWRAHSPAPDWKTPTLRLLDRVQLPATEEFLKRRPREISVGQAQRVVLAMALLHNPALLVADEPTSALDIVTQREILSLLRESNRDLGVAILIISHDLLSLADLCTRVAILSAGQIVEEGLTRDVFQNPRHPYTRKLIASLPIPDWLRPAEALA